MQKYDIIYMYYFLNKLIPQGSGKHAKNFILPKKFLIAHSDTYLPQPPFFAMTSDYVMIGMNRNDVAES